MYVIQTYRPVYNVSLFVYIEYIYILAKWLECSPMAWETGFQSQVESYQRLKK